MNRSDKSVTCAKVAWAAGFLEGEGCFLSSDKRAAFTLSASQVQREPLDRLQAIFGGQIHPYVNNRGSHYFRWDLHGAPAIGVAFTIYTFMSPRRREQIRLMVSRWKARPGQMSGLTSYRRLEMEA